LKKQIAVVIILLLIILFSSIAYITKVQKENIEIKKYNSWYESYFNKEIYGTEVVTIINKAIEENKKNHIKKDEKNLYIENDEDSIKIELKMITVEKTYQMETIYNNDINNFIKHFNLIIFKCSEIQYHKTTGKISKLIFEQIEK